MCFDIDREGCGLRFLIVKEPRVELPHTRHGVSGPSLCLEDLVPLSLW